MAQVGTVDWSGSETDHKPVDGVEVRK